MRSFYYSYIYIILFDTDIYFHKNDFIVFIIARFTNESGYAWTDMDHNLEIDPFEMEQDLTYFLELVELHDW